MHFVAVVLGVAKVCGDDLWELMFKRDSVIYPVISSRFNVDTLFGTFRVFGPMIQCGFYIFYILGLANFDFPAHCMLYLSGKHLN